MKERILQTPPIIHPVSPQEQRPFWSVMIPTYNCSNFLERTIQSVLAQDPGIHQMQIEVIDDCSTDEDVEALVKKIGNGRVQYYRQQENVGSLKNFETCLQRSKGYWVHLLHGDDMVKPGFYTEIKSLIDSYPNIGSAITSYCSIDENDRESKPMNSHLQTEPGIIDHWLNKIATMQRVQPPSVVVKREVYEQIGGFFGVEYGEDWLMWIRIAARYPVAFSPRCFAMYRTRRSNITSKSITSQQNYQDLLKVIEIASSYLPEEKRKEMKRKALYNFSSSYAHSSYKIYKDDRNHVNSLILAKQALKMSKNNLRSYYWLLRLLGLYFKNEFYPKRIEKVQT